MVYGFWVMNIRRFTAYIARVRGHWGGVGVWGVSRFGTPAIVRGSRIRKLYR